MTAEAIDVVQTVIRHEEQIATLKDWQQKQNGQMEVIRDDIQEIKEMLIIENAEIRSQIIEESSKKPSWSVLLMITTLSSICTGLAVYVLSCH